MDEEEDVQQLIPTQSETLKVPPDSPKPLAFTIDFGEGKSYDTQRRQALVEKFQNRHHHRRGQSLSKIEDTSPPPVAAAAAAAATTACPANKKQHPLTDHLTRKGNNAHSDGYFSSDEKGPTTNSHSKLRSELTLPLKNVMTQSFPNGNLNLHTINSPETGNSTSPKLEPINPYTINEQHKKRLLLRQFSSPDVEFSATACISNESGNKFNDVTEVEADKSDTVSDAGTYTLETDNYTEEQKARMSIDREFNIEQVSVMKKTEEYVQSLNNEPKSQKLKPKPQMQLLSPILSPTQNLSIVDVPKDEKCEDKVGAEEEEEGRILYPSPKAKMCIGLDQVVDQGCFTSVTSSGAFSRKPEVKEKKHVRQPSLTKSEIQIQTYIGNGVGGTNRPKSADSEQPEVGLVCGNLRLGKVTNLPPAVGGPVSSGKSTPTKIPSPVHSVLACPPRTTRNALLNIDLSDATLETESLLKPTQNYINSLQKRLSLDDDHGGGDDDGSKKCNLKLNNETQKSLHVRHNSFDDRNLMITNKLEHFRNKNLQQGTIDQTYTKNKLHSSYPSHKIQNSPNNSPVRRSSSFSTKNHFVQPKVTNLNASSTKTVNNNRSSPNSIQRSASTATIKSNSTPLHLQLHRRSSINNEQQQHHMKIDRSQYGDTTESSSEDDYERNLSKRKDFSNLTNTRYNRAFSLRRARLDSNDDQIGKQPKCPNTPEMRRKFQQPSERAVSVDRSSRSIKCNEVPSRYLQSITATKNRNVVATTEKLDTAKINTTPVKSSLSSGKPQVFSRTDSGRFSMRTTKPLLPANAQKTTRKDGAVGGKKQSGGGRSNSSLSSREVEFQNWKRRKSYDPMKAAAEGKRKAEMARKQNQNVMTQSYTENNQNQDCDSSPSHSSSVHRSQSFHGTAALERLISSEEEEDEDLTLSADEGFSPPMPSPCELSPARTKLSIRHHAWRDRLLH